MKLSDLDREHIEVLEALDLDENTTFLLLCRYFAYRGKRLDGRLGYAPNKALEATIRSCLQETAPAALRVADEYRAAMEQIHALAGHVQEGLAKTQVSMRTLANEVEGSEQ